MFLIFFKNLVNTLLKFSQLFYFSRYHTSWPRRCRRTRHPLIYGRSPHSPVPRCPYLSYMINGVKAADQTSPSSSFQI